MSDPSIPNDLDYLRSLSGDELLAALRAAETERIEQHLAVVDANPTYDHAREALAWCNSYQRMRVLRRLFLAGIPYRDWLRLVGDVWSTCDDISVHAPVLKHLLPTYPCEAMMTPEEWAAFEALPDRVTVFRGADQGINERGLCWSLDRSVAERFPFLNRYRAKSPVLVMGTVTKARVVAVKLDRQESEVIAPRHVRITAVLPLTEAGRG